MATIYKDTDGSDSITQQSDIKELFEKIRNYYRVTNDSQIPVFSVPRNEILFYKLDDKDIRDKGAVFIKFRRNKFSSWLRKNTNKNLFFNEQPDGAIEIFSLSLDSYNLLIEKFETDVLSVPDTLNLIYYRHNGQCFVIFYFTFVEYFRRTGNSSGVKIPNG
jgi:hypothetical protein